jgi:hypothetical protein
MKRVCNLQSVRSCNKLDKLNLFKSLKTGLINCFNWFKYVKTGLNKLF